MRQHENDYVSLAARTLGLTIATVSLIGATAMASLVGVEGWGLIWVFTI